MTIIKKTLIFGGSVTCLIARLHAENYIIQTDLDPSYDPPLSAKIPIADVESGSTGTGSTPSAFAIGEYGSRYDLYTTLEEASGTKVHHLASTVVGPYPSVTLTATSTDASSSDLRTRSDELFGFTVTVSGINKEEGAPPSMSKVYLTHNMAYYPDGEFSFGTAGATWQTAKDGSAGIWITEDMTVHVKSSETSSTEGLTSLLSYDEDGNLLENDYDTQSGVEQVTVWYNSPVDDDEYILGQQKEVKIFPKSNYYIYGITGDSADVDEEADRYTLSPEGETTDYTDPPKILGLVESTYPSSITQLRLYRGSSNNIGELVTTISASGGELIEETNLDAKYTAYPIDNSMILALPNLDPGEYVAIIYEMTPFDSEFQPKVHSDFRITTQISINANINTSE